MKLVVVFGCLLLPVAVVAQSTAGPEIQLQLVESGFTAPTGLAPLGDGTGRMLVSDQVGVIYALGKNGKRQEKPCLDLRDKVVKFNPGMDERGLLGLALHPKFQENHKFYVVYSAPLRDGGPAGFNHTMRLSEFTTKGSEEILADVQTERVVLEVDEPDWSHNGGRIAFGPDGYLYWCCGDGSAPNDEGMGHAPEGNGQHLQTLLGKCLRIDVNGTPYNIPPDNPFADGKLGRPEIFAYGLRNPWGISFAPNGDLIVVDVGQDKWEEINLIVNGGNYGWRVREGLEPFVPAKQEQRRRRGTGKDEAAVAGPDGKPFRDPVLVYRIRRGDEDPTAYGISITGGYIYRGNAFPQLVGKYIFADWSRSMAVPSGCLFVATPGEKWTMQPLPVKDYPDGQIGRTFIWSLGQDDAGEIYVMTNDANMVQGNSGKLYKLVPVR